MASFTDAMWDEIAPTYAAILDHPFNRELAAGSLSRERFTFYMLQDAHYLVAFARALALAAAKAPGTDAQVKLSRYATEAIVVERSLHEGFFRDYDLTPEEFAAARPSPACAAYGDFLIATGHARPYPVVVAAVVPCFQIYYEAGRHLHATATRPNPYQKWVDTYRDEGFGDTVREVLALTDAAHAEASEADRLAMREAYLRAARLEWMFWDSAYRLEAWPV